MQNKDKWISTIYDTDKNGYLVLKKELLCGKSFVPNLITVDIINTKNVKQYMKGKLLDLGCGNVPFYGWYKDSVEDNVCVDWADTLHKNEFLDVVHDLSEKLPFSDNEFDTILSTSVLEHMYNPKNLIKECARVLKKNGHLILTGDFSYCEHEAPYDYLRYTKYFYQKIAEEAGLEVVEIEPCGDGLAVITDILAKICDNKKRPPIIFNLMFQIAKFLFKKYYLNTTMRFLKIQPLGYLVVLKKG